MKAFEQARKNMVANQVMPNRVFDKRILQAMLEIPRHNFLENKLQSLGYLDSRVSVGEGRKMLAPDVFARMLQECEIKEKDQVLDIACGTGYSTVIISKLAHSVIGVDPIKSLLITASELVKKLGIKNISLKNSDILAGAPEQAPFDVIFINGALEKSAEMLLIQLKKGGRLVVIEPCNGVMKAVKYTNINGNYGKEELFDAYTDYL
jgi:protein-L-isoaspartate(D-aspartate) O-methyltransferase